jgi:transcriptional regulator with XRE-family HTH domain
MPSMKNPFSGRVGSGDSGDGPPTDIGFTYRRRVGRYLAQRRLEVDLTQEGLGRLVGMRPSAVSAIELGRNPIPPERYRDFADALGLKHKEFGEFLLEWTDPWLFALIYGDRRAAKHHLDEIPARLKPVADPDPPSPN